MIRIFAALLTLASLVGLAYAGVGALVDARLDRRLPVLEYRMCELEKVVREAIGAPPPACP